MVGPYCKVNLQNVYYLLYHSFVSNGPFKLMQSLARFSILAKKLQPLTLKLIVQPLTF